MNCRSELLNVTAMSSSRRGSVIAAEMGTCRRNARTFPILGRLRKFAHGRGTWNLVGARNWARDDGLGAWSPPDQTFGSARRSMPKGKQRLNSRHDSRVVMPRGCGPDRACASALEGPAFAAQVG